MKLIQKTGRIYLWAYLLIFIGAAFIFYLILTALINEDMNEKLFANRDRIVKMIQHGDKVTGFPPLIEVERIDITPPKELIKDTSIYNKNEEESEFFRQLTSIQNIDGIYYRIVVRITLMEFQDFLLATALSGAALLLFLFIGIYFINRKINSNLWKPFYASLEKIKEFSVEDEGPVHFSQSDISEFKELNRVMGELTGKVQSDYKTLKKFTENASHEIQTPLAILQTKLDLMAQKAVDDPELAALILSAQTSTRKLSRLNEALLLLTRIENRQFRELVDTDLAALIREELQSLEDFINDKDISLFRDLQPLIIKADPRLVTILLDNLLNNAIRHNTESGYIKIATSGRNFTITNSGKTINIEPDELFKRFTKADPSSGSQGLGLSIVKMICDVYGWKIHYGVNKEIHELSIEF